MQKQYIINELMKEYQERIELDKRKKEGIEVVIKDNMFSSLPNLEHTLIMRWLRAKPLIYKENYYEIVKGRRKPFNLKELYLDLNADYRADDDLIFGTKLS